MKRILFVLIALCFVSSLAFAQDATQPVAATTTDTAVATPAATPAPEVITLKGDIIDNMCAAANKDTLAAFVATHTKDCVLKCASSGYSIVADGKLNKLDAGSYAKVSDFLSKADSKLQVTVTAKQVGDELSIVSIENQK